MRRILVTGMMFFAATLGLVALLGLVMGYYLSAATDAVLAAFFALAWYLVRRRQ